MDNFLQQMHKKKHLIHMKTRKMTKKNQLQLQMTSTMTRTMTRTIQKIYKLQI